MLHAHMNVSVIHALQRTHYSVREMQIMSEFNTQPGGTQPGNTQPSNAPYGTQQQTPYGQQAGQQQYQQHSQYQQQPFGQQSPYGQTPQQPKMGEAFFNRIRAFGIYRGTDRWIGGVASGIAHRLGWDPLAIRIIILALTIIGGSGILLYAIAWLLLPDEKDASILVQDALFYGKLSGAFWVAILFLIIGCPGTVALFPLVAVTVVAIIIAWIIYTDHQNKQQKQQPFGQQPYGAQTYGQSPYGQSPFKAQQQTQQATTGRSYQQAPNGQPSFNQTYSPYQTPYSTPYRTPYQGTPVANRPEQIVKMRKPAGPTIVGITAGLLFISLAVLVTIITFSGLVTTVHGAILATLIWVFAATAILGIITVATGISGRKSGGLIPLTIVALITSIVVMPVLPTMHAWHTITTGQHGQVVIENTDRLFTADQADQLFTHGAEIVASNATIDLQHWSDTHGTSCPTGTLNIETIMSNVDIILPQQCTAHNETRMIFSSDSIDHDWSFGVMHNDTTDNTDTLILTGRALMSQITVQYADGSSVIDPDNTSDYDLDE